MMHRRRATARACAAAAIAVFAAVLLRVIASCTDFSDATPPAGDDGGPDATGADGAVGVDGGASIAADPESDASIDGTVAIVTNEVKLGSLAVGPANVYYTQDVSGGAIARAKKSTANASPETLQPNASATDIALMGETLFATSTTNNTLTSVNVNMVSTMASATVTAPTALAVDGDGVAFLQTGGAAKPGAFTLPLSLAGMPRQLTTGTQPAAIAMDSASVYAGFGTQIRRLDRLTNTPNVVSVAFGGPVSVVAVAGNKIYVATGSRVVTLPTTFTPTTAPTKVHDYGTGAEVTAIRATSALVFIATQGPKNGGTVHSVPIGAGQQVGAVVVRFPDADCKLPDMDIDDTSIYFLCNSAMGVGSVWRVTQPAP